MKILLIFALVTLSANAAFKTQNQISGTATNTTTKILDKLEYRTYLVCMNTGSNPLFLKLGSAQSGTEGLKLNEGATWEPNLAPKDSILVRASSGVTPTTYFCIEGV